MLWQRRNPFEWANMCLEANKTISLYPPHGSIKNDFHNDDAGVEGFVHLFPEGCADPNVLQA